MPCISSIRKWELLSLPFNAENHCLWCVGYHFHCSRNRYTWWKCDSVIFAVCLCFLWRHDLCSTRHHVPMSTRISLVNALISSCLDYCNLLVAGITSQICWSFRVFRTLARVLRNSHPTSTFESLYKIWYKPAYQNAGLWDSYIWPVDVHINLCGSDFLQWFLDWLIDRLIDWFYWCCCWQVNKLLFSSVEDSITMMVWRILQ